MERPPLFNISRCHGDPDLIEAVRKGRREEFAAFGWQGEAPDPQNESTFAASKLTHDLKEKEPHRTLRLFYQELLRLRRDCLLGERTGLQVSEGEESLLMIYPTRGLLRSLAVLFYFGSRANAGEVALPSGIWKKMLDSADGKWAGPGSLLPPRVEGNIRPPLELQTRSFVVLERDLDRGRPGKNARTKYPFEASSQRPRRGGYYRPPSTHNPPLTSCRAHVHTPEIATGWTFALEVEPWCERRNVASNSSSSNGFASQKAGVGRLDSRFPGLEHHSPKWE